MPRGVGQYERRELAAIRYVVLHHSGVDVDSVTQSIAQYHVDVQKWPGIGYHFLVHWGGQVDWCNDLETISYHVAGRNKSCIGICIPGDWGARLPPVAARTAAHDLVVWLRATLPSPIEVVGHSEVALPGRGTNCPGVTWPSWRAAVV